MARGVTVSQIVTEQAVYVDEDGNVFRGFPGSGGPWLGKTAKPRPGWSSWGLEAAGPPFDPPPTDGRASRQREGRDLPAGMYRSNTRPPDPCSERCELNGTAQDGESRHGRPRLTQNTLGGTGER
jgi:hypothetical protein